MPLLLLLVLAPSASAQSIPWTDGFGSSDYDSAWGVVATDTDVFVDGYTFGALPGASALGDADGFLRRTDASGHEVWTVQFGTAKYDAIVALGMDATGLYVTGSTTGVFPGQTKVGAEDAVLAKYDLDGNELWTVQFGTTKADFPSNVVADTTGVYVIGGTLGGFPGQHRHRRQDVFLTRFDADGNQDWTVQFGTDGFDTGYANALGPGGVFVNGFTDGRFAGQTKRGGFDAFVGLFGTDGTRSWLRQFGTERFDSAYGIVADADAVYVSGETAGHLEGPASRGETDAYVRAFSAADGSTLWTRQFGSPESDASNGLGILGNEVYAIGTTHGVLPGGTAAGGRADAYARAFDAADGDVLWTHQFGTTRAESGNWAWTVPGALYVAGSSNGTFPDGSNAGGRDAFVTRIDLP